MPWRPSRRALRRLGWGLGAVVALYLGGVNLLLNTPLGPGLVNLRPRSVRFAWRHAWTVWPGHVTVRGLEIQGKMRSRAWSVSIESASAKWGAFRLLAREARFSDLRAEGVSTRIWRVPYTPPAGTKPSGAPVGPPVPGPLRTWKFSFAGIDAQRVGTIDLYGLVVDCAGGDAAGSFGYQLAGEFRLEGSTIHCRGARLDGWGRELAKDLEIEAQADLTPYSPRRHPGLQGFDFLSGRLRASGVAETSGLLARVGESIPSAGEPARLQMDLNVAEGMFLPESVLLVRSGADAPSLELRVAGLPPTTQVRLTAPSIQVGGKEPGSEPLLATGPLEFVGATPERRVSKLFAATRALGSKGKLEGIGLRGTLRAAAPRVNLDTPASTLRMAADRLSGTVDLAALLTRQLWVEGLEIEGLLAALTAKKDAPPPEAKEPWAWAVALYEARFPRVRELALNDDRLVGPFDVALSAGFSPSEGFEINRLRIAAPRIDVHSGGAPVSRGAALDVDLKLAPVLFGLTTVKESLRTLSGSVGFKGRVESLGILRPFLRRPWLRIDGKGDLDAAVAIQDGRLAGGSRVQVAHGALEARFLDSVARGTSRLDARVSDGDAPRIAIDVVFPRYEMASSGGERSYLRGRDLRLALASSQLDLADVVGDLTAKVTLHGGEIPDLRVYNAYLPPGAGIAIRSGSGTMNLDLQLDQAAGSAKGGLSIASPAIDVEFADVQLSGRLALDTRLRSKNLESRDFDIAGTRLRLDDVAIHETGDEAAAEEAGWWAQLDLTRAVLDWQRPMTLAAHADVRMKDSGFLLSLASRKKRFLSWFKGVLDEEDVHTTADFKLGGGAVVIDPLRAEGGSLDVRARMRLAKSKRAIDLFVRHGHLAAGLELRDGKRDIKILRPEAWYESREGFD